MKEILITSSVLILALLALRAVFRRTISRRVQYALWLLVLVRLLVPVSLPSLEHNVLTAAEPAAETVSRRLEQRTVYVLPTGQVDLPEESRRNPDLRPGCAMAPTSTGIMVVDEGGETATVYAGRLTAGELLRCVWLGGVAVMACWFLVSNLRFWRKLRKARMPYSVESCRLPVYLVESGLPSPCLFGLFRPAVYLTPAAVSSPDRLRHVLAHETTHARHLDPLWSLLRSVCLAVYWFDPLVWAAALVSRTDCELACDEGALRRLGAAERIPYGQTLLSLIPVKKGPGDPLLSATTMTAGKRRLKDRITRIAEDRRTVTAALFAAVALVLLVCIATFTGADSRKSGGALTPEELAYFNEQFFNNDAEGINLRNQFLTSLYERPEDIDMFQLFYNGTGLPGAMDPAERQLVVDTFYGGEDPEVDLTKLPAGDVDAVLREYTGLTLADTQALGMGGFSYLADYDAYYHFHGDTNAPGSVLMQAGERKGDTVLLYYDAAGSFFSGPEGDFFADGWACVTLRDRGDGVWWFVSNQLCDRPDHLLPETRTLSSRELAYFNEEFFNGSAEGINLRNQFLTSLYARPEDIDLYELFYCGTGTETSMTAEEEALVCNDICPTDKLPVSAMNEVLLANTGLTLGQTMGTGLENFTYLAQYDAYYHTHGDTNYFADVVITAGERAGSTVRLYYSGVDGPACVTLEERTDGAWWFVSNLPAGESPVTPTEYPAWDPERTISLADLAPYEPRTVTVERHRDDCAVRGGGIRLSSGIALRPYQSADGKLYAAIVYDEAVGQAGMASWDAGCFFTFPEGNTLTSVSINSFSGLFGCSGAVVSYFEDRPDHTGTAYDYYDFPEDGAPLLLAHVLDSTCVLDLDGDGGDELLGQRQLIFRRDGALYEADLGALLAEAWPDSAYTEWTLPDRAGRCFTLNGFVDMPEWGEGAQAWYTRWLYFDGDSLLLYKDGRRTTDHLLEGTEDAPAEVIAAARDLALTACRSRPLGQDYDDWRVTYLHREPVDHGYPLELEVWTVGYELHLTDPGSAIWVGGTYTDENGWFGGFNEGSPYLIFLVEDGQRTLLENTIANDVFPESPIFRGALAWTLLENGAIQLPDIPGTDLSWMFYPNAVTFFNRLSAYGDDQVYPALQRLAACYKTLSPSETYRIDDPLQNILWNGSGLTEPGRRLYRLLLPMLGSGSGDASQRAQAVLDAVTAGGSVTMSYGGKSYTVATDFGNGPNRIQSFAWSFRFYDLEGEFPSNTAEALKLSAPGGGASFLCWPESLAVFCTLDGAEFWLMAQPTEDTVFDDSLFAYFRFWFDEAEWSDLTGDIVIPDRGQSRVELARAWAEQRESTALRATSGSKYARTYVRIADVELWDWVTPVEGSRPPAPITDEEWFVFGYSCIFVPENDTALSWSMAGNTGDYDGSSGEAPEGALVYSRCGYLYRAEDGWRCAGLGTGP